MFPSDHAIVNTLLTIKPDPQVTSPSLTSPSHVPLSRCSPSSQTHRSRSPLSRPSLCLFCLSLCRPPLYLPLFRPSLTLLTIKPDPQVTFPSLTPLSLSLLSLSLCRPPLYLSLFRPSLTLLTIKPDPQVASPLSRPLSHVPSLSTPGHVPLSLCPLCLSRG